MRLNGLRIAAATAILLGTVAVATPALATNHSPPPPPPSGDTTNEGGTGVGVGVGVGIGIGKGGEGGRGGAGGAGGEGGSARQHQNQQQQQHQSSTNVNANLNDNSNSNNANQSVHVETNTERAPVNTAYAAPLVAGEDTCMGSSSIGGQGVGFGLSIGTSWTDDNCQRLKNARQLAALGFSRAAVALVCVNEDVQNAMEAAGTPCPATREERDDAARVRNEERAASTERQDDTRVAHNSYGLIVQDIPAATAPVEAAPARRVYHPMQPISN